MPSSATPPTPRFPVLSLRRVIQIGIDAAICAASLAAAYLLRFDGDVPAAFLTQGLKLVPVLVAVRFGTNLIFGIYRVVWRYIGIREALLFVRAVAAVSSVLVALRLLLPHDTHLFKVPLSVIFLEGMITFILMSASRLVFRIRHDREKMRLARNTDAVPTLLVGAGQNGLAVAKEALRHPMLRIRVLGFLDDDRTKTGMEVNGLRIRGTLDDVESAVRATGAQQIIITTSTIPSQAIIQLINRCRAIGVTTRIVPGLFELLGSTFQAAALREVRIEDLLSRDPISPSKSVDDLTEVYRGKRILVTGAGGSIGSELCRQLLHMKPQALLLLDREENNLFEIHRELTARRVDDFCMPLLADVTDEKQLGRIFRDHKPHIVFHAAAYKHVPMMERYPASSARNNVFGTKILAELSDRYGVSSFVMISTDKAVNPTSVMGATKRLAELLVQRLALDSKTKFSCVRFGNVLGSRGSVVPIFREQIAAGGPVTVTHPEITRYFMTIPEAANLVLQAATQPRTAGEIFMLDMGEPVKIIDLARQMIQLSGATEEQIPIKIVGARPGEKLYEELRADAESLETTDLRKVFRVKPQAFDPALIDQTISRLDFSIRAEDHAAIRDALENLGIGYKLPARQATESGA